VTELQGRCAETVRQLPRDKKSRHFLSERLGHLSATNVGNTLEGEVDIDGIAAGKVVLDGLNHKLHQVIASTN